MRHKNTKKLKKIQKKAKKLKKSVDILTRYGTLLQIDKNMVKKINKKEVKMDRQKTLTKIKKEALKLIKEQKTNKTDKDYFSWTMNQLKKMPKYKRPVDACEVTSIFSYSGVNMAKSKPRKGEISRLLHFLNSTAIELKKWNDNWLIGGILDYGMYNAVIHYINNECQGFNKYKS